MHCFPCKSREKEYIERAEGRMKMHSTIEEEEEAERTTESKSCALINYSYRITTRF